MTAETATLPDPLDTKAREAVKSEVVIVDTPPAIFAALLVSRASVVVETTKVPSSPGSVISKLLLATT